MPEVEIPFTDQELDSDEPVKSGMTMVLVIIGLASFFVGSHYAQLLANRVLQIAPGSGNDGVEVV